MTIGVCERMRIRLLILIGAPLLVLLSESAFCDSTLNAGDNKTGASGTIIIGNSAPDFTNNSGTIVLNGDASIVSYGGGGNKIKLGLITSGTDGAAIYTSGHTITGIVLNSDDLDQADAGTLTISGGNNALEAYGAVNINGEISTATAELRLVGVSGRTVAVTATAGGINFGTNSIETFHLGVGGDVTLETKGGGSIKTGTIDSYSSLGSAGGAVTLSTAGSGSITTGRIYSYSDTSAGGNGGAVNLSTAGSGSITTGEIYSYSSGGAGGDVTLVTKGDGSISTGKILSSSSSHGNGGAVTISTAGSGSITTGDIKSCSYFSGAGGAVAISTAGSGEINVGIINSYSKNTTGGAVKILAVNGILSALGTVKTNGTVTINAGELAGNIGNIGDASEAYYKTGQVDITIGSVTGSRSIGAITTNNADINIEATITGAALTLGAINAGTGSLNFNVTVGKGGTLSTASTINLSGGKGILTLDFGDTSLYAKTTGLIKSAGTTEVTSIYGINGLVGTTYSNVFSTEVVDENGNAYVDGTELNNTKDEYRNYILTNGGKDIYIKNNCAIRQSILDLGGSQQVADAANSLVEHQGEFDAAGQAFVDQLTALSGRNLLRGSREHIGEKATEATMQSGLQSINAASGSVRNKMTTFRMGNLASGLASSFSSTGSTAATSDMSDADELSDAYSAVDSGCITGNTVYHKLTVWANAFGGFGEQGTKGDTTGYDFWNAGTMVGLDYAFAEELRIGGLFGYSYNKTKLYENSGNSIDNALRLGAYSSYNWDNYYVDLSSSMGIHIIESNRNLITNGLTAKGERTGLDFNINGVIGYTFSLPKDVEFTPSYSIGYTLFHDPSYAETGGGVGNLSYSSFNSHSLLQDVGVKFGRLFRVNERLAYLPEVWGGWEVEYLNTGGNRNSTTSSSIGGNSYSTSMSSLETNRGYWGIGITALLNDNISIFGRYDHKIWNNGYNVGFSSGIRITF